MYVCIHPLVLSHVLSDSEYHLVDTIHTIPSRHHHKSMGVMFTMPSHGRLISSSLL